MKYELCSPAEVLQKKLAVWESRLAYAKVSDKRFVPECERAIADLRAKLALSERP